LFSVENAASIPPKSEENRMKQSRENKVGPYSITNVAERCIPTWIFKKKKSFKPCVLHYVFS